MKKIIVALLVFTMLFVALVPVSAADVTIKSYDEAVAGELLYTFNFKGDNVYTPKNITKECSSYTFTPSEDGSAITIKSVEGSDKVAAYYGGIIKSIKSDKKTVYSIVYRQKALSGGTAENLNRVGVGAWFSNKTATNLYHAYVNYTEGDKNIGPALHKSAQKIEDYYSWAELGEIDQTDGYATIMVEYNSPKNLFTVYTLKKDGDIKNADDWFKIQSSDMGVNNIADGIGCAFYMQYSGVDVEIKNVELYKGTPYVVEEETTEAPTTEAPSTEVAATDAPAVDGTEAPTAEGGCGATVSAMGVALVMTLGSCAVITSKKRRH